MSQNDLTVKDAAALLNVSTTTIYRMCKRGNFPNHYREEQQIFIPRQDLDNYLQRQQQEAAAIPAPPPAPEPIEPEIVEPVLPEPPAEPVEAPSIPVSPPTPSVEEPQWLIKFREQRLKMKRFWVKTGIKSTARLEQCAKKWREKLEQYKTRIFPD